MPKLELTEGEQTAIVRALRKLIGGDIPGRASIDGQNARFPTGTGMPAILTLLMPR